MYDVCHTIGFPADAPVAGSLSTYSPFLSPRDRKQSHRRHLAIVRAIRAGDPDAAERVMQNHMELTVQLLEETEHQRKQAGA